VPTGEKQADHTGPDGLRRHGNHAPGREPSRPFHRPVHFTVPTPVFLNLTINGAPAGSDLGGVISAAPEPTTFAPMGVGGLFLLAPVLRRKARVAA
jgi:hypothetical protein